MSQSSPGTPPSPVNLRQKTIEFFGQTPCLWQIKIAKALLKKEQDIILVSATGSGKTLTFWIPLLAIGDSVQVICTPLNLLGTVNVAGLAKKGIPAICITGENATQANFGVSTPDIAVEFIISCIPGHCKPQIPSYPNQRRDPNETGWRLRGSVEE